jgi:methyl-accepting chemotaxis protein
VTQEKLMSGSEFLRRLMLFFGVISTVAVVLVAAYFQSLMSLSPTEWTGFLEILLGVAPVVFIGTSILNRPLYTPVSRYLASEQEDAEAASDPAGLRDAFRALSDMPYRFFVSGLVWWTIAGALASGLMAWRFETYGGFRFAVMLVATMSGGFVCSVFMFFGLKRLFRELRTTLSTRIGDPAEREILVRRVSVGRKLRWSITGVTFVTVAFALFLSLVHGSRPLEVNTVEIQSRFLAARADRIARDPAAIEDVAAEARELGIAAFVLLVDPGTHEVVGGDEDGTLLASEVAAVGNVAGGSLSFESPHAFAWHPLGAGLPSVVAVQPWKAVAPSAMAAWLRFGITLLVSAAIALVLAQLLAGDIGEATSELGARAASVASGDLRLSDVFESEDELGELSRSFEQMAGSLRVTVRRVAEAADRVDGTATETATVAESVASAAEVQGEGVVETSRAMQGLSGQVGEISGSAQELNLLVEDASSSMMELGASGEQLADTATVLFGKVDEVSSSIQQGVQSMRQVSTHTTALADAAENTSTSMLEMASNMREVNTAADDSAELSKQVVETAEKGRETVRQTVASMESIRRATDTAEQVIRGLGESAGEIGSIVGVIGDVADETNLLALNAAIIAAQAGENGRAFSVVAEQIKELADRVLTSTKEIGDLIRALQEESASAVDAVSAGSTSVAEGVRLSNDAGASLEAITRVSRDSGDRITRILGAVQEQTRASSYVVEQMESVKQGVEAIQRATAEQDRGNEVVVRSTEAMREIAQQLQTTTGEQSRGSMRIRESIEGVRGATESINSALQSQTQSCQTVGGFLEELTSKGESNEDSARRMQEVARQLLDQANALRGDVERFRV